MNIAIVGSSGHFSYITSVLSLRAELNLCAVTPGSPAEDMSPVLNAASQAMQTPKLYADWRVMLDHEDIDIVAVNPWFCDTADISIACLRRGIHVFSKKPLATTLDKLNELEQVWRDSSKALLLCICSDSI